MIEHDWPALYANAEKRVRNVTREIERCRNLGHTVNPDHWKRLKRSLEIARGDLFWAESQGVDLNDKQERDAT